MLQDDAEYLVTAHEMVDLVLLQEVSHEHREKEATKLATATLSVGKIIHTIYS